MKYFLCCFFVSLSCVLPRVTWAEEEKKGSETLEICFNYSCITQAEIVFPAERLQEFLSMLSAADSAVTEREQISVVIGKMYALAAEQSPVGSDRGGNFADQAVFGRMDCIDHSTTTTRFLKLLEQHGGLRWHKVMDPVRRGIIFQHLSALIEVLEPEGVGAPVQYVVDSWFVDNGKPAVVMPLDEWMSGGGPSV